MGLSSSGPAQTLAVSLAGLVAASGYGGPVPILICLIPMLGIAIAYQRLNRWDQSAGATYTWVARVFNPYLGFLSGWMILLYYTLGTTTLTIPAGVYTLDLIAPSLVDRHWAVFVAGAGWNVLITVFAVTGLKLVVRFEWAIVLFQYAVLLIVAVVALHALAHGLTAVHFSWAWFSLSGMGGARGLMGGMLIACFMYSGWDAAIYVNEETRDRANNPGRAAIASVAMLAAIYSLATLSFQAVLPPEELQAHAGDALAAVSEGLLHGPWGALMALVVLLGTLATLQAAVVSAARMGLAMSRDRVMPAFFCRLRAGGSTPWAATLTMSAVNIVAARAGPRDDDDRGGAHECGEQPGGDLDRFLRDHRGGGASTAARRARCKPRRSHPRRTVSVDRRSLQRLCVGRQPGDGSGFPGGDRLRARLHRHRRRGGIVFTFKGRSILYGAPRNRGSMKYKNPARSARSAQLYQAACGPIPGGVNSTARATWSGWDPYPLVRRTGRGRASL